MKKQDDVGTELKMIEEKINAISLVIYEFNLNIQHEIDSVVSELCKLKEQLQSDDNL